jgi:hypothetical protein
MGKKGTDIKNLWEKSEERNPSGRTRRRCDEKVNLGLGEIRRMERINLAEGRQAAGRCDVCSADELFAA